MKHERDGEECGWVHGVPTIASQDKNGNLSYDRFGRVVVGWR